MHLRVQKSGLTEIIPVSVCREKLETRCERAASGAEWRERARETEEIEKDREREREKEYERFRASIRGNLAKGIENVRSLGKERRRGFKRGIETRKRRRRRRRKERSGERARPW